jgi:peptidoglycan/xylan/chitin deacetylase (PgdA/CDA1 family)
MDVPWRTVLGERPPGRPAARATTTRAILKLALSAAVPRSMLLVRGPARGRGGPGRVRDVALTFDDGPHPEHTPRLLDMLCRLGIKATFFVVGAAAEKHRSLVARIAAEAHDLGNHTYSHRALPGQPPRAILEEVRRTRGLIEDITGRPCDLFRPPRGELSPRALWHLWGEGETVVLWSVDTRDHRMRSAENAASFSDGYRARGGDILLMHDDHAASAAIVGELAARAPRDDVRFVPVSRLLPARWGEDDA